jgi:hypothetical protein
MSQEQSQVRPDAQAGSSGETSGVGPAVGGGHSKRAKSWHDESGNITSEHLAWLKERRRASARSQACQRSEGQGDGSVRAEIATPEKVRKLQRALYRKAKAEPKYRFWSLYGDLMRREGRMPECDAMKRPGKPDTGNPSVRFDEGSESDGHWLCLSPRRLRPTLRRRLNHAPRVDLMFVPPTCG